MALSRMSTDGNSVAAGSARIGSTDTGKIVVRGTAWTLGSNVLGQVISWSATIIVAQILTQQDYGIVAMGSVFVGLVWILTEFGFGSAILRFRDLTENQVAQVATLSVMVGVGSAVLVALSAVPLSKFYRTPELVPVVLAQALSLIINAFRTVPVALMRRNLDLRAAAMNDFLAGVLLSVSMVIFAMLGFRHWTLVIGSLLSAIITALLAYLRQPHRFAWPRRQEVTEVAAFGWHVVLQRFTWYFYSKADILVVGRIFGKAGAGAYSFAAQMVTSPIDKITALSPKVISPAFAANQDDRAEVIRLFLRATEGFALLTFPAAIGFAAVSRRLVEVVLPPHWSSMVAPMQILALSIAVRSITPMVPSLLNLLGYQRKVTQNGLRLAVLLPIAFLVGSKWGLAGVASAWLIVHPFSQMFLFRTLFRALGLEATRYFVAIRPALVSAIVMGLSVLALDRVLGTVPPAVRLGVEVVAGAAIYALLLLVLFRDRTLQVVAGIKRGMSEKMTGPEDPAESPKIA